MAIPYWAHVPGGIYYLSRKADPRHPIFSNAGDYVRFEAALRITLGAERAKLLAYCWLPDALHLIVEVGHRPAARFMRALMSRYNRNRRDRPAGTLAGTRDRNHATLVRARGYLVPLICQLHYLPVRTGLVLDAGEYPHSSHRAYLGQDSHLPVCPRQALAILDCPRGNSIGYQRAMAAAQTNAVATLFEHSTARPPRILDNECGCSPLVSVRRLTGPRRMEILERLITRVAEAHAIALEELCSNSRRREVVIARALITWLATLSNLATLNEIASRLRRKPSTLRRAAAHYRRGCPAVFTPEVLARRDLWNP
jgi:REP-associated tyrosine transposase